MERGHRITTTMNSNIPHLDSSILKFWSIKYVGKVLKPFREEKSEHIHRRENHKHEYFLFFVFNPQWILKDNEALLWEFWERIAFNLEPLSNESIEFLKILFRHVRNQNNYLPKLAMTRSLKVPAVLRLRKEQVHIGAAWRIST